MKHKKLRTVPAKQEEYVASVTCDICGAGGKYSYSKGAAWDKESYEVNETELRWRKGSAYPEGGSGEEWIIDICPKCFEEKLLPWLHTQGAAPEVEEWDF